MNRSPSQIFKYSIVILLFVLIGRASISVYKAHVDRKRVQAAVMMREEPSPVIKVHIAGAVNRPGLYELKTGSRLQDAITAAGGFLAIAEKDELNLAALLEDGQKIVVKPENAHRRKSREPLPEGWTIDINTATAIDFQQVPGLGPTLSQRIVELRQMRGPFQSIEEIKLVKGIGDWRFEQVKKYLSVEDE